MAAATAQVQGYIEVEGGRVWYESAGRGPRTLLLLHGGPGGNSEDLAPFLDLAELGFRVVRFDQLGSWRSDQPDEASLWDVPRFVREVESVRKALDLGQMHLLGQSWGAFLALEYALHYHHHLRSLILASGAASTRECVAGMTNWKQALPPEMQAAIARHEATGDYGHPEFVAAMDELYRRHFCRVSPVPERLATAIAHVSPAVYNTMWGPNEFTCTGTLLKFDRTERLGEIRVPTLITVGEFDEVHPDCARTLNAGIAGSELVIFRNGGHAVILEQPDLYRETLVRFLERVDRASAMSEPGS